MDHSSAHPLVDLYDQAEAAMRGVRTALAAEQWGSELLGIVSLAMPREASCAEVDAAVGAFVGELTGLALRAGDPVGLAVLRALSAVAPSPGREIADRGARRLAMSGVKDRAWATAIGSPAVGECYRYADVDGRQESVVATFWYGSAGHALMILIDHERGGGIKDCWVADGPRRMRRQMQSLAADEGSIFEDLTWEETRGLLREALARPDCPVEDDQVEDVALSRAVLLARLRLDGADDPRTRQPVARPPAPSRSPRRGQVLQLKVSLKGAKPPIWRRLEVPADVTLDTLSEIIQLAFDWAGFHLYLFETPRGTFGDPEMELDLRSDVGVPLSRVAKVGERLEYTYDFGDDWVHRIEVEKRVPAVVGETYPRCTAGRRAAPPEDCGGIWAYESLLALRPDAAGAAADELDMLAALPEGFDPASLDVKELNEALAQLGE